ncbi:MAG: mCpol domain-containing protein [Proteobacteria bacterium]|nr:mCpol domain-containing protein [Pseudomonadota bacterium]
MKYIYIDGDDIGLRIENSFLNNNEKRLSEINRHVKKTIKRITKYLTDQKYNIIFSGADGIICKADNKIDINALTRSTINDMGITFSVGIGNTLHESYIALRYAKCHGKNRAICTEIVFT